MHRRLFAAVLLLWAVAVTSIPGKVLPLTVKDICLMLRSGYSSDAIQQDLVTRRFVGPFDMADEKSLKEAGAAAGLIDGLKNGAYQISPREVQAVQEELVTQARQRALAAEESRKYNTLYQDQLRRSRAAAATAGSSQTEPFIANLVKGDLVSWRNGSLSSFDDEVLGQKQLIALYFSARWCGPCRQFTPKLVEYYNRVSPQHPEFEVLFFSRDRSPAEMQTYVREMGMPWPAIDFDKLANKSALKKYEGDGIPCLVLLDSSGNVISDSYAGKTYLGPEKVLADLDGIFANGLAPATASR